MADKTFNLQLIHVAGNIVDATVVANVRDWTENDRRNTEVKLDVQWPGGAVSAVDRSYHASLCRIREQLAVIGFTPRCYGACRNLVISGMSLDMGLGEKGYLARLGHPCMSELVNIFESGPEMDLATVSEQMAFKELWIRSLKSR